MCRRSGGDGFVCLHITIAGRKWIIPGTYWINRKSDVLGECKQALPMVSLNANLTANTGMLPRVET